MENGHTQGVNLGGWFIPEKWMTPDVFTALGASDLASLLAPDDSQQLYESHLERFITETDFQWLAQHRVGLIRLPVSYLQLVSPWIGREKLDWAMAMAEKYDMHVLLDYHGAIGSQNGKDHSGQVGQTNWQTHFVENLTAITTLAERYATSPALWGIELLNEPEARGNYFALRGFYRTATKSLRRIVPRHVQIIFHDSFQPLRFIGALGFGKNVAMDMHLYEIPVKDNDTLQRYMDRRDRLYRRRIAFYGMFGRIIIGEWSGVLPHSLIKGLSKQQKHEVVQENIQRQQVLYERTDASFFWSYRTSDVVMWNFRSLVDQSSLVVK